MNKSESKYFHTALLMDEALIALLEKKDLEYITVKEICEKAGVHRSTFYLHYETIADLLNEAMETVNRRFQSYFPQSEEEILNQIAGDNLSDLILITKAQLCPYLQFIFENKNIYRATLRNPTDMQADARYGYLKTQYIEPILQKFRIPSELHKYYTAYYVDGISAIIKEWLNTDCRDSIDTVVSVIEECVHPIAGMENLPYGK